MPIVRRALLAASLCLAALPGRAADLPPSIGPRLAGALAKADPGQLLHVTIRFRDTTSLDEIRFAAQGKSGAERRAAVRALLAPRAAASQAAVLDLIARAARENRAATRVQPVWIIDAAGAQLTPSVVLAVAARPEVERIELAARGPRLFDGSASAAPADPFAPVLSPDATLECGVETMRANEVWSTYHTKGAGVVIALIDTGSCYTHPDIKNHIWVNPGEDINHNGVVMDAADKNGIDDDGNGYVDDLIGWDFGEDDNDPNDTDGHGSHTAGTLVGDGTGGRLIGMAPAAKLMVIRVGMSDWGDEVDSWAALQYAADNGADVCSMSFGWYHGDDPDRAGWRRAIDTVNAMGMLTVNAAGNAGSSNPPDDVGTPPDVPGTIAVGATDCSDVIASFSSQGPVSWATVSPYFDLPNLEKPEVSGPGVGTWSLDRCSGYTTMSGTSMAAPHVAGAVALVLARKPGTSQDEMKQILESTAVDLGDPGWDRAYGYGRVDAFAAAGAIGGWLNFASYRVLDPAPAQGNGDGAVDLNERITLPVTLHNSRTQGTATAVSAVIRTATPGVALHDDVAFFPDAAAGASVESLAPHFTFDAPATCGGFITFALDVRYDDGQVAHASFLVPVGTDQDTVVFSDDFETDRGWTRTGSTSTAGFFVREDPHLSKTTAGVVTQPEDDHTPGTGTKCYVTGNHSPIPSSEADDVDGGIERLVSPRIDLRGWQEGHVDYWEWTYLPGQGLSNFDNTLFEWSNDDGATWTQVGIGAYPGKRQWTKNGFSLHFLPVTDRMRFRVSVTDGGIESTVDTSFDDFSITGTKRVCENWSAPVTRPPNPVGATLRVSRATHDVRLDWDAPPVDATHDAATLYRVHRADAPAGPLPETASSTVTWHVDANELTSGAPIRYYMVTADNE